MARRLYCGMFAILFMFSLAVNFAFAADPEVLFDVDVDKTVNGIYLIGENEDHILVDNKARMWVYDANSGKLIWETKVKGFDDDGLNLIWNDRSCIVSLKKGMRSYDIPTGKVVWETETPLKMKKYTNYFNFSNGFVLNFGGELIGFNPNTGDIKWQSDKLDFNGKLYENGIANIYSYSFGWGERLLVLGNKQTQVLDAETGKIIGVGEMSYSDKNDNPVVPFGEKMVLLLGKKGSKCVDLKTGKELWFVEENVDPNRGMATFEYDGGFYGLFAFRNKTILMNLDNGELLWEKGKEMASELEDIRLYPGGLLMITAIKNITYQMKKDGEKNNGSYNVVYGIDLTTGDIKYETTIGFCEGATIYIKIPFVGEVGYRSSFCSVSHDYEHGALFYFYAVNAMKLGAPGGKWKEPGGEGLGLIDPLTGELKWKNDFVLFDSWSKPMQKANAYLDPGIPANAGITQWDTPPLEITGDFAYLNGDNKLKKIDLNTGNTVWESPEYGLIQHYTIADGRVFGEIGYSRWRMGADAASQKGSDIIDRSKDLGYFVLDDASGKELFNEQKLKNPVDLFAHDYVPGKGKLVLCDGKELKCLNVADGKWDWKMDLKKELTGPVSGEDGVAFVLTGVSKSYSGYGSSYTISTTKSYDISMEHGVFPQPDGSYLVLSTGGPAMVGLDGKVKWKGEWKWNAKKVNFVPETTSNGILYQYKKNFNYYSLKDGSVIWESKEKKAKDVEIFLDSNKKRIFFVAKKNITAYKL